MLSLTTQLDNTNLAQPITKQCLILFSLWCKKVTLAIKEKHDQVKVSEFLSQICINFLLYEEFWGIMCYSLLYFAILAYIN